MTILDLYVLRKVLQMGSGSCFSYVADDVGTTGMLSRAKLLKSKDKTAMDGYEKVSLRFALEEEKQPA